MATGPLEGLTVSAADDAASTTYASRLLELLGATPTNRGDIPLADPTYVDDPTGLAPVTTAARGALLAFEVLTSAPDLPDHRVLSERGPRPVPESLRFLETTDGWVAVNLAREDDRAAVPAIVESAAYDDPWTALEKWARDRTRTEVVDRCRLLAVPAAAVGTTPTDGRPFVVGLPTTRTLNEKPLVVDLSSLWAGPLCSRLLRAAGARVIKVESATRPDGARLGPKAFWDRMHDGKEFVSVDFRTETDRLAELIASADVVIEGSRPRALAALGITPTDAAWVSLTAYGRDDDRVGFGDDTAVAGGLVTWTDAGPTPMGDAVADPLAGLHAAVAAAAVLRSRRGALIEVALRDVAAYVAAYNATA